MAEPGIFADWFQVIWRKAPLFTAKILQKKTFFDIPDNLPTFAVLL
jgi:hypothetical protein